MPTRNSQAQAGDAVDVSIIIVGWNSRELLGPCLDSLRAMEPRRSCQVIVVDNASRDDTVAHLREHYPEVELIANAENVGFARGNNQGLERARGRTVLLLNPDTEVRPDAVPVLLDYLVEHPGVGACGPK